MKAVMNQNKQQQQKFAQSLIIYVVLLQQSFQYTTNVGIQMKPIAVEKKR